MLSSLPSVPSADVFFGVHQPPPSRICQAPFGVYQPLPSRISLAPLIKSHRVSLEYQCCSPYACSVSQKSPIVITVRVMIVFCGQKRMVWLDLDVCNVGRRLCVAAIDARAPGSSWSELPQARYVNAWTQLVPNLYASYLIHFSQDKESLNRNNELLAKRLNTCMQASRSVHT